jgi:catechol 2,3-dioxygenase-like lactoylglutathione lyase family enzyme
MTLMSINLLEAVMNPKVHVSLDVTDIQASISFYSALFNTSPTKVKPGYAKFDMEAPAINLTLQEIQRCCIQGLSHLGIRVDSLGEVAGYKARLNSAGIETQDELGSTCCRALQDKVWASDPTGYRWEVYVFKGDIGAEQEAATGSSVVDCNCRA